MEGLTSSSSNLGWVVEILRNNGGRRMPRKVLLAEFIPSRPSPRGGGGGALKGFDSSNKNYKWGSRRSTSCAIENEEKQCECSWRIARVQVLMTYGSMGAPTRLLLRDLPNRACPFQLNGNVSGV